MSTIGQTVGVSPFIHIPAIRDRKAGSLPDVDSPAKKAANTIEVSMKGTIKRVVREKGFGFIVAPDGKEVFFHRTGLQGVNFEDLQEGTNAEFEVEQGAKGARAMNVRPSAG
jgi:CspA family cold shock protein